MTPYTISIFDTFESVQSIWKQFEEQSNLTVFQTYDWLSYWYKEVGQYKTSVLIVVVKTSEGQPLLLLPLGITKEKGVRRLEWLGGLVSDYGAPLISKNFSTLCDESKFKELWKEILIKLPPFDLIHLIKQPERVEQVSNPFRWVSTGEFQCKAYSATLPDEWDLYKKRIKKKILADSRRQKKRLGELGTLHFKIADSVEEKEALTKVMIRQKRERYQATGATDLFNEEVYQQFYQGSAKFTDLQDKLHLSMVMLDDTILATHWGAIFRGHYYFLMPTYEARKWARYSTGRLLLEFLMEWAIENHCHTFDFTVGGEEYKKLWCDQELSLFEQLESITLKGKIYKQTVQLKNRLRNSPRLFRWVKKIAQTLKIAKT